MSNPGQRLKSKFIKEPPRLAYSGSLSERPAMIRWLQRIFPRPVKSSLFRRKTFAARRFEAVSAGSLTLASNIYRGHERLHFVTCLKCQNEFKISYSQLRDYGSQEICPFCHPLKIKDIAILGSPERIQAFTYNLSSQNAMLMADRNNPDFFGGIDQWGKFFCCVCGDAYHTSIKTFLENAGNGNGCPRCHAMLGRPVSSS